MKTLFGTIAMIICTGIQMIAQNGGVGINTTGSNPDPSAIIDASSTSKGALFPRMTTAQRNAIASPAKGLYIYNTDCDDINYNAGTPSSPDWVSVTSSNSVVAGVSITASPVGSICQGAGVTFTAAVTNGGNSPTYQWIKNGAEIPGAMGSTYANSSLSNGDLISCVITSDAQCVTGSPATSNAIAVLVNPTVNAGVSVIVSPSGPVCAGTSVTFTATPVNGGTIPTYQWKRNGSDISGAINSTYVSNTLSDEDEITCVMTSNQQCVTGSPVTSNITAMDITPILTAGVSISANPSTPVCPGGTLTFTATPSNGGSSPQYQWKKGGIAIDGATGSTYASSALSSGDVITCELVSNLSCVSGSPATSNSITVALGGGSGSQVFLYTGSQQTFTVPACVSSITIEALGAQGADATGTSPGIGGQGGYAAGSLAVNPGDMLYVYVGGQSGWNGGGNYGGNGNCGPGVTGGRGGDASDVRLGGTAYNDRIIVAGGGGGGGAYGNCSFAAGGNGGAGGGAIGGSGVQNYNWGNPVGGVGGSQSSGGSGGPSCDGGANGSAGSFAVGGDGHGSYSSGGGGGGGYYGGGGGGTCSSGSGGGGGSSWTGGVTGGTTASGQRIGLGQVTISW